METTPFFLSGMSETLAYFKSNFKGWNLAHMENFLAIAAAGKDGITNNELMKRFTKPGSTNNLIIQKLVNFYGLVDAREDPAERRRHLLTVSKKGLKAVQKMESSF